QDEKHDLIVSQLSLDAQNTPGSMHQGADGLRAMMDAASSAHPSSPSLLPLREKVGFRASERSDEGCAALHQPALSDAEAQHPLILNPSPTRGEGGSLVICSRSFRNAARDYPSPLVGEGGRKAVG